MEEMKVKREYWEGAKVKDISILVLWLQLWEIKKNSEGKLKNMDIKVT